VVEWQTQWT